MQHDLQAFILKCPKRVVNRKQRRRSPSCGCVDGERDQTHLVNRCDQNQSTVSSGQRSSRPPPAMALISLEDLDGLDDDQLEDDITDNPEPMDEEDRDQLLAHWQAVASTHHVSVPPDMTVPIQEMTRNNQQREPLAFTPVSCHEKMGEVLYEERVYPEGHWACVTRGEDLYEQSISMGFMKLMRFICKENSAGRHLGMTVPVVTNIHMMENGKTFKKDVQTAYFLPAEFQTSPPQPSDSDVTIVYREPIRVIARTFFGTTTEETLTRQISRLWEILGVTDDLRRDEYLVAAYENPGVPRRRNEIWFVRRNL